MNDQLHDLLDRVARPGDPGAAAASAVDDLARARTALRRRQRRTFSAGLGALTTLAVLGAGTAVVVGGSEPAGTEAAPPSAPPAAPPSAPPAAPPSAPGADASAAPERQPRGQRQQRPQRPAAEEVRLVAQPMAAGPYTFGTTPEGWEVQNNEPFAVTIRRIGETNRDPASFVGKLVIMLDDLPLGGGERVTVDGREMVVRDNGDGYVTVSVATRPGEPQGTVRVQFPADLGWTRDAALTFLSSVVVGPDAEVVHG